MATGINLRKKFAFFSLLVATPILIYLLLHHGASVFMAILITLSLIPAFFTTLSGSLLQIPSKLTQDIGPLQKNQVEANVGRLVLLSLTIFIYPWAFVAMLAAGLPQIWSNWRLRKLTTKYADLSQKAVTEIRNEIIVLIKRVLPDSIYYCLSGQITIWLISIFGSTTSLAQIGALGRIAMVLNLFSVLFITLILPRFARIQDNFLILLNRYLKIQAILLLFTLFVVFVVWVFPEPILWILGEDYSNLGNELLLNIIGSCLALIAGSSFHLCTAKGWAINPLISITLNISSIIFGVILIDISSLHGILLLNILIAAIQVLVHVMYGFIKIFRLKKIYTNSIDVQ